MSLPHRVPSGRWRFDATGRAALYFVALTLVLSWPLAVHLPSALINDNADAHLFLWTLAWDAHAFLSRPLGIFDANIYYPETRTLAYSENAIGSAIFAAPILWLTDSPVLALNLVLLFCIATSGIGAFILARRLGLGTPAALVCGTIFAFAPPRFFRIAQLHLTAIQWVPLALASLHTYLDHGRARHLRLWAALFTLQALSSGHGVVFLILASGSLLAYRFALGEPLRLARRARDLGAFGAALLLPAALTFIPYRAVQVDMGLRRSLVNWAPSPESFLAAPTHLQSALLAAAGRADVLAAADAYLFPGYLPILLACLALWRYAPTASGTTPPPASLPDARRLRRWSRIARGLEIAALAAFGTALWVTLGGPLRLEIGSLPLLRARDALRPWGFFVVATVLRMIVARRVPLDPRTRLAGAFARLRHRVAGWRRDMRACYVQLTAVALLLSMGPPLGIWPLVYWLPVLNFIRVPSRFTLLALLGLAILAAFGFERLARWFSPNGRRALAAIILALLIAEFAAIPLRMNPFTIERPAAERWLAGQPTPFAVVEIPVARAERTHTRYMLHSMAHWQKTVHGYSGIRPRLHTDLYARLRTFPNDEALEILERLGVDYLVAHGGLYPPGEWMLVEARLATYAPRLTLVHAEGEDRVYRLVRLVGHGTIETPRP